MRPLTVFTLLATLTLPLAALDVGEKAPSLAKITWMKGGAVEPGSAITVVEFWATWCGPCRKSIPHLTGLQKKYGDKVKIVGISNEDQATVKPFIDEMGAKMDYHVGIADVATYGSYMEGVEGIPHAFVVDAAGTVVWAGHPGNMDQTLDQVVAGTFDAKKAAALGKLEGDLQRVLQSQKPDIERALKIIDGITAIEPVHAQAISVRLAIAKYQQDPALVRDTLTRLPLEQVPADFANGLAFARATEEDLASRHLDVAFTLIDHALSREPDNAAFLDTKARLFSCVGLLDQAIAFQRQAVEKDPSDEGLAATLAYYQSAKKLAGALSGTNAPEPATKPAVVP
jgi:thiol-disulfide isomerase/thioredoxin